MTGPARLRRARPWPEADDHEQDRDFVQARYAAVRVLIWLNLFFLLMGLLAVWLLAYGLWQVWP